MRCLAKAIALHGLGLYIYAGEDLPESDSKPEAPKIKATKITPTTGAWEEMDADQQAALTDIAMEVIELLGADLSGAFEAVKFVQEQGLSSEETIALWTRFDSKQRAAMKKTKEPINLAEVM